jgi:hypothetical protein
LLHATGYALLVGIGPLTVASTAPKLFPIWVWEERFAAQAASSPVPPVTALASPRLRDGAVAALMLGVLATAAGIVLEDETAVAAGTWLVVAGAVLFAAGFAFTARWALLRRAWTPPA